MIRWRSFWIDKSDYFILVPILALAFYLAFIPNLHYSYPVHIDEWVHIAYSQEILRTGSIIFDDPFTGEALTLIDRMELGFQSFWGVFQRISGIPWPELVRYFPSVVFVFTTLAVYIFAKRQGFGWEAAFFACLIPTNIGIMGPAFLLPVSMALLFAPLCLFMVFSIRSIWSYLVLFVFMGFLIALHGPSAICILLLLIPFILINLRNNLRHSLWITLAVLGPFIVALPFTSEVALSYLQSLFVQKNPSVHRDLIFIIKDYGYPVITLCGIGTFILALKGGRKNYSLVLCLLIILLMLALFFTLRYGILIVYLRGILFGMLLIGIVAGAGLRGLREFSLSKAVSTRLGSNIIIRNAGLFLCLLIVGLTLYTTIPSRQSESFYQMINDVDYKAFTWIRDNVGGDYDTAILDPWKATAFTAITGKHVYTRIHTTPDERDEKALAFLEDGCKATEFLKENGISIIYSIRPCDNADFVEVRENVYLLK